MATTSPTTAGAKTPKLIKFAIPLLGIMAAIQGSSPNINSTALVSLTRDLNMAGGQVALAASIQTIAIAASVITTGLLADRLGRRKVLLAAELGTIRVLHGYDIVAGTVDEKPDGAEPELTMWSTVSDLTANRYLVNTYSDPQWFTIDLATTDFSNSRSVPLPGGGGPEAITV